MTNEFWDFSLATYAEEGVAQSLLAMQDELGLDVNVLLYASALRDEIKALELRAEHQQQALMWSFFVATDTLPAKKLPLAGNLNLVCRSIEPDAALLPTLLCHLERSIGV